MTFFSTTTLDYSKNCFDIFGSGKPQTGSLDEWETLPSYAGRVTHHNACKSHIDIDTGFKQTEGAIFLHVISMG